MSRFFNQIVITTDTFAQWLRLTNQMANTFPNVVTTATNTAGDLTGGNGFVTGTIGGNTVVANYRLRGGTVDTAANLTISSNVVVTGGNSVILNVNSVVNSASMVVNANTFAITGVAGGNSVTITTGPSLTNSAFVSHYLTITGNTTVTNSATFSNSVNVEGSLTLGNVQTFVSTSDAVLATQGANSINLPNSSANVIDSFSGSSYRGGKYVISVKDNANSLYQMTEILLMHDGITGWTTEYATLRSSSNNLATFVANLSGSTVRLNAIPQVGNSTYVISRSLISV